MFSLLLSIIPLITHPFQAIFEKEERALINSIKMMSNLYSGTVWLPNEWRNNNAILSYKLLDKMRAVKRVREKREPPFKRVNRTFIITSIFILNIYLRKYRNNVNYSCI